MYYNRHYYLSTVITFVTSRQIVPIASIMSDMSIPISASSQKQTDWTSRIVVLEVVE